MIQSTDFAPVMITAAAWAPADTLQTSRLFAYALGRWPGDYDGDPELLPADVVPPEVPAATLVGRNRVQHMGIAARRVNLIWQRQEGIEIPTVAAVLGSFADRLIDVFRTAAVPIGRVAVVLNRLAEHENPGRELSRQFCRPELLDGPLNRPEGFELHAHKVYDFPGMPGLRVNSWVRARTAKRERDGYRWVTVEQDINSLQEERETRQFAETDVREFFARAAPELDNILALYFPADSQDGSVV